jgi:hypothetical protein
MISRIVNDKEEGMTENILEMEKLFPDKINYESWDVWDNLQNPNNINLVVEEEDKIIGYVLAIPQEEAVEYLKEEDPLMKICAEMCYIDQVAVVKDKRGGIVFSFLLEELAIEAQKRGFKKWSSHVIVGLEGVIRRKYREKIISERKTTMPSYGNYDLIYMEGII